MGGGMYNLLYIKECEDFLADEELMENLQTVIERFNDVGVSDVADRSKAIMIALGVFRNRFSK